MMFADDTTLQLWKPDGRNPIYRKQENGTFVVISYISFVFGVGGICFLDILEIVYPKVTLVMNITILRFVLNFVK